MEVVKFCGGAILICAMLAFPETALNAAREAMAAWYYSVAPSLFPFMVLMPALTAPGAAVIWEKLLGRWMRPLLGLPGSAAPALAAGMVAGSPAGAAAAVYCPGLTKAETERLVCCVCGFSPGFLITGIGASMLGNAADGRLLLRSQLLAQLTMLLLTRRKSSAEDAPAPLQQEIISPVRAAVANILTVCGYMVVYSVAAALISGALGSEIAGTSVLCILDMPSAARRLAQFPVCREGKLLLLSAVIGFGGLCAAAQNLSVCGKYGVNAKKYMLARVSHGGLCTAFTALFLRLEGGSAGKSLPPLEFSALISAFFAVPALISLKNDRFLNKRNFEKLIGE